MKRPKEKRERPPNAPGSLYRAGFELPPQEQQESDTPKRVRVPLSPDKQREYDTGKHQLIKDVAASDKAWARLGQTLFNIHVQKLWRAEFDSFNDFCLAIFGYGMAYGYRLISFYKIQQDLKAQGVTALPENERVARQLLRVPKKDRVTVWNAVIDMTAGQKAYCENGSRCGYAGHGLQLCSGTLDSKIFKAHTGGQAAA